MTNTNTNRTNRTNNNKEITMHFSPYQATKLINAVLTEANLPSIPPQMMYNYTTARIKAGKATLIGTVIVDDKVYVTEQGLNEWLAKYLAKKGVEVKA